MAQVLCAWGQVFIGLVLTAIEGGSDMYEFEVAACFGKSFEAHPIRNLLSL